MYSDLLNKGANIFVVWFEKFFTYPA